MSVVLHYFECRSRGQALRFALVGSGVDFEDRRVPIEAVDVFREKARDAQLGGPFASLPVLDWDDYRVAQTLAVASYLSARLGFDDRFGSLEERARDQMIVSAAHLDMQAPYSRLLWCPADLPDAQLGDVAQRLLGALRLKLLQLEGLHAADSEVGAFFGGFQPSMADYFVYESIDRACAVFGSVFEELLAATPRMARLRHMLASDPELAAFAAAGGIPRNVTASPSESAVRARLASLPLDPEGE
jgi:hypothetical protein